MDRDRVLFEAWWLLVGKERVAYHYMLDFSPAEGDLLLFDECDELLFDKTHAFGSLVGGRSCICFTATPGGAGESDVLESQILKWLGLNVVGAPEAAAVLKADKVIDDLHHYIDNTPRPVLVFCTERKYQSLIPLLHSSPFSHYIGTV